MACDPKPFTAISPNTCYVEGITDYANNGCLKVPEECKGYYDSSNKTC